MLRARAFHLKRDGSRGGFELGRRGRRTRLRAAGADGSGGGRTRGGWREPSALEPELLERLFAEREPRAQARVRLERLLQTRRLSTVVLHLPSQCQVPVLIQALLCAQVGREQRVLLAKERQLRGVLAQARLERCAVCSFGTQHRLQLRHALPRLSCASASDGVADPYFTLAVGGINVLQGCRELRRITRGDEVCASLPSSCPPHCKKLIFLGSENVRS
mmetsp:Transcript_21921/g.70837  ORF Transcript_21921/g.70837 Transcript_21921/m.70837 type:complete len:219 (-) Transcript_21921:313-969(-)